MDSDYYYQSRSGMNPGTFSNPILHMYAAVSYAIAASSAVSKVPSQTLVLFLGSEDADMTSPPLILEDDEYTMEGSCKNKVKFGKLGVTEDAKEATGSGSSKYGAVVNGGRVSKRFRGIELFFISEAGKIELDWFFSLNFAGIGPIQVAKGASSFIEVEFEHERSFSVTLALVVYERERGFGT
ncbi:hypothetical protein CR513_32465, partial [Mucuna pruriens]